MVLRHVGASRLIVKRLIYVVVDVVKYKNRAYFCSQKKRIVRIPDLVKIIQNGDEIRVRENDSGKDVTLSTLLSVISHLESVAPQSQEVLSPHMMEDMVRFKAITGISFFEALASTLHGSSNPKLLK